MSMAALSSGLCDALSSVSEDKVPQGVSRPEIEPQVIDLLTHNPALAGLLRFGALKTDV